MIGIFNYGHCNINSITNALRILSINYKVSSNFENLKNCEKIIFPGVGNMKSVNLDNLDDLKISLNEYLNNGGMVYGICLGLQLFFDYNGEADKKTLGLIRGETKKICDDFNYELNVQFCGLNDTEYNNEDIVKKLFKNLSFNEKFYYLHKFYCDSKDNETIIMYSLCNKKKMPSMFIKKNIIGTQFHPELSKMPGLLFLKNFCEMKVI